MLNTATTAIFNRQGSSLLRKNGAEINSPSSRQPTSTAAGGRASNVHCSIVASCINLCR